MSTIENIKQMILEDSHRWQCPNYSGVVVVPEDLVGAVSGFLKEFLVGEEGYTHRRQEIRFDTGARLLIRVGERSEAGFQQEHCGMCYTSIMVANHCTCYSNINYL
ncbi:MAG: hypothetical protein GY928_39580, partial [Colwellia sp.]|nr:hypothetical protein [Colwellia sp.]